MRLGEPNITVQEEGLTSDTVCCYCVSNVHCLWACFREIRIKYTHLANGERISYTPSIKCLVDWTTVKTLPFCSKNSGPISIMSWSHEKRYQALPAYTFVCMYKPQLEATYYTYVSSYWDKYHTHQAWKTQNNVQIVAFCFKNSGPIMSWLHEKRHQVHMLMFQRSPGVRLN